MAIHDDKTQVMQVSAEQRLQVILAAALAEATGRALREIGHQPPPEQLRQMPGFLMRLADAQAAISFTGGPPRLTQVEVDEWAEQLALDLVSTLFGPPPVLN